MTKPGARHPLNGAGRGGQVTLDGAADMSARAVATIGAPDSASGSSAAMVRNSYSNVHRSGTMLRAEPPCTSPVWAVKWGTS